MKHIETEYDVGVIIGRFQVSELHDGHHELITHVLSKHKKTILLLGQSPLPNSFTNPLDFQSREWMIRQNYPHLMILPLMDRGSDEKWSRDVDTIVSSQLGANQSAVLYGSRDSFIKHYDGKFSTVELLPTHAISGTEHRTEIGKSIRGSADWRASRIHASQDRFPTAYAAVDIAVFDKDKLLIGKKPGEDLWRLPGGFADPNCDGGFEADAVRELLEETNLVVSEINLTYVGSFKVEDWRYKSEPHCIKTILYLATKYDGTPKAGDDLEFVKWETVKFPLNLYYIMPNHRKLIEKAALKYYQNIQ